MYNTDYLDGQFVDEFKLYAEKPHLCQEVLVAKAYSDATVLPFVSNSGGGGY